MGVTTETMLSLSLKCDIRNIDDSMPQRMPKAMAVQVTRPGAATEQVPIENSTLSSRT